MKYLTEIFTTILMLNILCPVYGFTQDWEWQNPLPTGNRLYCMDFVDSLCGWFGSSAGTILHTIDGGNSWEIQYTGINNLYFNSIDFIDQQHGWVAGNPDGGPSYIFHTFDGGESWEIQAVDSSGNFRVITFIDKHHGWVSLDGGNIYYTIDGGENWELGYAGKGVVTSIVFLDSLHGWADGQHGMPLLYSEDGGKSWKADSTVGKKGVKVFFLDSQHGWVTSRERVLRTMDGGKTWLEDLPKVSDELLTDIFFVDTFTGWVASGDMGTYRTTDGGWTWEQITTTSSDIKWGGYRFFTPLSGWIDFSRTWDGGRTLVNQKKGFTLSTLWDVDFIDENTGWVVGSNGLIAKTTDGGKNWHLQESGTEERFNSVFALDERRVWAVGLKGVIAHTKDGGWNWESQYYVVGTRTANRAVTFIDSMKGWIGGDYIEDYQIKGFFLYTEDGGKSWIEALSDVGIGDITFVDENKGWALGSGGIIYSSCDGGKTWIEQLTDGPDSEIIFLNENIGWASRVSPGMVWGTRNGGETWTVLVDNLSPGLWGMTFISEQKGWVTGSIGNIWKTEDGGKSWQRQKSGTTNTLWAVDFVNENEGWVVGNNGTILHTAIEGTTDIEINLISEYTVKNFHLFSNYPNPFNPKTVISYQLPEKGSVKLTIYDMLGREVITLVDKEQSSGLHRTIWDGKDKKEGDVPSGIYFYNLQFGGVFQKTGKMILIK